MNLLSALTHTHNCTASPQKPWLSSAAFGVSCQLILTLLMTSLITSCGFQLRGYGANAIALDAVAVKFAADEQSSQWDYALKRQLRQSGISVSPDAATVLTLSNLNSSKDIVSYDSRGKAAEYEIVQSVSISIETRNNSPTAAPYKNTLSRSRVYTFDPENVTGKSQEERLLTREIQAELIRDIVQRLGDFSQLQAVDEGTAAPSTTPTEISAP